eukprot:TRINITY_DN902_c0_g1_i1.p1 TRINITY_DN902_c0_g1~~TRINITY_DN902_c0_g1_i1.p1  ORF type:complete len:734 (+),score=251.48 TRINITY_DN902_c0_g1_i1:53-2254(+)
MHHSALALVVLLSCSARAVDLTLRNNNGQTVSASSGSISDGYNEYPADSDRSVSVAGRDCVLTWRFFDVEESSDCKYDFVELQGAGGESLGKYCGGTLPGPQMVRGDGFTVRLYADAGVEGAGFVVDYDCTAPPTPAPIPGVENLSLKANNGVTVTANSGTITDGYDPEDYPADADRSVTVVGDDCLLTFTAFDIEPEASCGYDFVQIRDASGASVGKFCGTTRPAPVRVAGGRFSVRLSSDAGVEAGGFSLSYVCNVVTSPPTPVPPTPTPVPPTPAPVENVRLTLKDNTGARRVATSGTVSDGWGEYPSDTDVSLTVLGDNCELTWTSFDVETEPNCDYDYIELLVGTSTVGKYCGGSLPPMTRLEGSSGFTIALHSDPAVQGSGFAVDFVCGTTLPPTTAPTPVPPTTAPTPVPGVRAALSMRDDDGAAVSAASGSVVDGYSNTYAPNQDHSVTVWGRDCELSWTAFDVEFEESCDYDFVEVRNGAGASVGKYCGATLPAPLLVQGEGFTVALVSDAAVQGAGFELAFTCSAAVPVPVPPPTPVGGCGRGTNLDVRWSVWKGASRMRDFNLGVEAAVSLLEAIMCRDSDSRYPPHHTVRIGAEVMNSGGGGVSGGIASTPNARSYSANTAYDVTIASRVNNQQGLVWTVAMHEITHTLSIKHVGVGYMLSGQLRDYQFIDKPIADALRAVGVRFIDDVDARLQRGEKVQLDELLQRFTPYTYAGLRAMRT